MGKKRRKQHNKHSKKQDNQSFNQENAVENGNKEKNFDSDNSDINKNNLTSKDCESAKPNNRRIKKVETLFASPVGLSNLGNTCFFNSIMQNLLQTHLLHNLLKDEIAAGNEKSLTVDPTDGETPPLTYVPAGLGELSTTLSQFFDSVKSMQQSPDEVVSNKKSMRNKVFSPRSLFGQICSKNERFRGYQQQDSQELYHCLLDGIKTEDIKRKKRGILKALNLNKPSTADEISEEIRQRVKAYGVVVSEKEDTIVEKVFGGKLVSSVLCDNCHTVTGVIEPFHDISLPIVEEKVSKPNRNEKSNKSDDSDASSIPDNNNNADNKKPMSKHAMKKARKAAEKEAKRSRRRAKEDAQQATSTELSETESVEKLADVIAEEALSLAMQMMFTDVKNIDESEPEESSHTPKLKGGAVSKDNLNLPFDVDGAAHDSESKIMQDMQQSEKPKSNDSEMASDLENEESLKSDDCEMDDLESRVKNLTLDDQQTNGASQVDSDDSEPMCGLLFQEEEEEEEQMSRPVTPTPPLTTQESSLFDTPKRHDLIYTSLQSCSNLPETLSPRELVSRNSKVCTLESCFYHFTMPEMLTESNKFGCEVCTKRQSGSGDAEKKTVYCDASKQILIKSPPSVLTIHLKRFQQVRCSLRKVNRHVNIPTLLDISPFCEQECEKYADEDMKIVYGLYGMVEHSGSLSRGHYTAYVRCRSKEDPDPDSGQWYHISDTQVTKVSAAKALKCNAYLIFYERLSRSPPR